MVRRNWVRVVLVVSLTLNLLAAGFFVGSAIGRGRHEPRPPGPPPPIGTDALLGPLGGAFSREDRGLMRRAAEQAGADLGVLRTDLRADMEGLISALEADPWDPDLVRGKLAEMREQGNRRAELGETVMMSRFGAMSAQERRDYADRLRERFDRSFFRGPPDGGPPMKSGQKW